MGTLNHLKLRDAQFPDLIAPHPMENKVIDPHKKGARGISVMHKIIMSRDIMLRVLFSDVSYMLISLTFNTWVVRPTYCSPQGHWSIHHVCSATCNKLFNCKI